jgi:APA family basic amino acid/polyamine antiporter
VALISGFTPIRTMGDMSSLGTLFAFLIVSCGVMVLRLRSPNQERSFKCPAVFVVAPLAIIGCGYLIYQLLLENYKPFLIWYGLAILVYFLYAYRKSALNENNKNSKNISSNSTIHKSKKYLQQELNRQKSK